MSQLDWAYELSERLLAPELPRRWAHCQGVAGQAQRLAPILGDDAGLLHAAAILHDVGYSPSLVETELHLLDGARYLRRRPDGDVRPPSRTRIGLWCGTSCSAPVRPDVFGRLGRIP